MQIVKLGNNVLELVPFPSKLLVKNKLSKRPAQVAKQLRKLIEGQNNYNISMTQDYSKDAVKLNLLSKCLSCNEKNIALYENGHQIYQSSELPVTSAISTYKKVVQQMIESQKNK